MELNKLVDLCKTALENLKAEDLVILDVMNKSSMNDVMIFATGTSTRHVKSLANAVNVDAKAAGVHTYGLEGTEEGQWVLVDLGDVVVHVMLADIREFYQLERLWAPEGSSEKVEKA